MRREIDVAFQKISAIAHVSRVRILELLLERKINPNNARGRFSLTPIFKPELEPVRHIQWPVKDLWDFNKPLIGIFQSIDSSEFNFMLSDGSQSDLQAKFDLKLTKFDPDAVRYVSTYWRKEKSKEHTLAGIKIWDKNNQCLLKAGATQTHKVDQVRIQQGSRLVGF